MARTRSRDLAVGAMFALTLVVLALAVMSIGSESNLLTSRSGFRVNFPNADGLVSGSPVKMSGVRVGAVTGIRLPTDPEGTGIDVDIGIDSSYASRIREDSTAALRILQLLTGEKFVEVVPGSPDVPALEEGSLIPTGQGLELLEQANMAAENLNEITVSLKNILGSLERGEGLIGRAISDPEFGKEGIDALHGTLTNLEQLTEDLTAGRGLVGRLIYDEQFASKLDQVGRTLDGIASLIDKIDLEQGAIGGLLVEGGPGDQAIEDLRAASGSMRRVAERLESSDGLVGRLLNDTEYSEALANDFRRMLANLAEISDKINRGEGTLGAVVNERALYDGMEDVIAGVNDSKFARWLLRKYRKKGIEAQEKESKDAEEAQDKQDAQEGQLQDDQQTNEPTGN